jgi:hypothetical protein
MLSMQKGSWREAMLGSVSLYAPDGARLHRRYVGEAPNMARRCPRSVWREHKHRLKHEPNAIETLIEETERLTQKYHSAKPYPAIDNRP